MVICLERDADDFHSDYRISGRGHSPGLYLTPYFHFRFPVTRRQYMVLLMPLHPIISFFIKILIRLAFLVPAFPGCPGKETIERTGCLYF